MKNIDTKVKGEEGQGQSAVAMKMSKQVLTHSDRERWLGAPAKTTKSQNHELGRHKRLW